MSEKLSADELERLAGAVKRYASAKADAERIGLGCSIKACYDSDRQYLGDRELLADQYLANHATDLSDTLRENEKLQTDLAAATAAKEQAEKWQWRFSDKLIQDEQCHDWGELFAEVVKLASRAETADYPPQHDGKRFHVRELGSEWQVYGYGLLHVCMCDNREVADMVAEALEAALREPAKEVPLPDVEAIALLRQITANADVSDDALIYAGSATWEDWRNHVPIAVRMVWKDLSEETRRAVWSTCFAVTGWKSPSPPPPASEPLSRSRLKREAVQRGEELPSFAPTEAREPTPPPAEHFRRWQEINACDVCGNVPYADGVLEHGRGCFVEESDGGGTTILDEYKPADAANEIREQAERLLRLTCEHVCGTPVDEQSSELADISLAIDSATAELRAENERLKAELERLKNWI